MGSAWHQRLLVKESVSQQSGYTASRTIMAIPSVRIGNIWDFG